MSDTRPATRPVAVPIAGALGVTVRGIDLRDEPAPATMGRLRALLAEHHLIVFKDQQLEPASLVAFARLWGELSVHPRLPTLPQAPEVVEVHDSHHPVATTWHQDQTFLAEPPSMTMLSARRLPDTGGDTMFANQQLAYDTLSPAFRSWVDPLRAIHRRVAQGPGGVESDEAVHPVAPRHPASGRRALFVNADYTVGLDGWTPDESEPVLRALYAHAVRPEFTCRHRWSMGDAVLWDNRSLLHAVIPDSTGPRLLHKVTMAGGRPD